MPRVSLKAHSPHHADNHDALRFPPGFEETPPDTRAHAIDMIGWIGQIAAPLNFTYNLLGDAFSRRMLIDVMAYRVLGPTHIKLRTHSATYQTYVSQLPSLVTKTQSAAVTLLDGWLNRYNLKPLGFPIEADLHPLNVLYTYQLQQYRYNHDGTVVEATPGDFAIDGGGCWGDTALYLAHKVGPTGRVHCFEFSPDNLPTLQHNLSLNPALQKVIRLEQNALWSTTGDVLSFNPAGPRNPRRQRGWELSGQHIEHRRSSRSRKTDARRFHQDGYRRS